MKTQTKCVSYEKLIHCQKSQKIHRESRSATIHKKVLVTWVGDIWRARGARAYNGGLWAEPPAGPLVEGQGAKPPEAERFWQNVKICT